jgi:hypothetical protein
MIKPDNIQRNNLPFIESLIDYCYFFSCTVTNIEFDLALESKSDDIFFWYRLAKLAEDERYFNISQIASGKINLQSNIDEIEIHENKIWLILDNFDSFDRWKRHPDTTILLGQQTSIMGKGVRLSHINQKNLRDIQGYFLPLNKLLLENERCLVLEFKGSLGTPIVLDTITDGISSRQLDYYSSTGQQETINFLLIGKHLEMIVLGISEPNSDYNKWEKYDLYISNLRLIPTELCDLEYFSSW